MVVTLQNGVDAVDIVARHVGREHTAGGVAYVAAVIDPPGTIRHTALDALIVGELDGAMSPRLLALQAAAARAGFGFTASPHILVDLWSKFARLSVFSAHDLDHALAARRPAGRAGVDGDARAGGAGDDRGRPRPRRGARRRRDGRGARR